MLQGAAALKSSPWLLLVPTGAIVIALLILSFGVWTVPAAAVVIIGVIAFWRIDLALYALVFLLPVTALEGMAAGYNETIQGFKRLLLVELMIAWVIRLLITRKTIYLPRPIGISIALFSTAALASILRAPEPAIALTSTGRLLSYCIVYVVMVMNIIESPRDVWRTVRMLLISASLTAGFALYQLAAYFVGWRTFLNPSYETIYVIPRVHSFMLEPLQLASYLLFVSPIALALYIWRTSTWPVLTGVTGVLVVVGIVISGSRSGWLVFALTSLLFLGFAMRQARWSRVSLVAALVTGLVVFTITRSWLREFGSAGEFMSYVARFATLADAETGAGDMRGRLQKLSLIREAVTTSPIIGIGTNNVGFMFHRDMPIDGPKIASAGNTYLNTFIETGGLGVMGFVALLCVALWTSWHAFRYHRLQREGSLFFGLFIGTLGVVIHMNFYGSLSWTPHGFLAIGLTMAANKVLGRGTVSTTR
jgi:O-antigen ligase